MSDPTRPFLDVLETISGLPGARGALFATGDGAFAQGRHSGLEMTVANDVAKTVRRMVVASTTVGAPLEELIINLGAARMMVRPIDEDTALVVLLERHQESAPFRENLKPILLGFRRMLEAVIQQQPTGPRVASALDNPDDEIADLVGGELGPVLRKVELCFMAYVQRLGGYPEQAAGIMSDQLREWLLCCNPSPHTLPLLLDGLSQTLNHDPGVRAAFMAEMEQILKDAGVWQGTTG